MYLDFREVGAPGSSTRRTSHTPRRRGRRPKDLARARSNHFTSGGLNLSFRARERVLKPDPFAGTWEITVHIEISPSGQSARGVGHGTGELQGMTLKFTGGEAVFGMENPCNAGIPVKILIHGEILARAS